jgi:hypothetical protein
MGRAWFVGAIVAGTTAIVPTGAGATVTEEVAAMPAITSAIWMGDSLAFEQAPGVQAALESAGLAFSTYAYPGVSLSGDAWLNNGETWLYDHHEPLLAATDADVVIWQLSRFDTISPPDILLLTHATFVDMALRNHQAVVFVTAPPVADSALMVLGEDWEALTDVASQVAERHPGRVFVVDSVEAWGTEFVGQTPDGTAIRKPDGVHICPLGARMFADFLVRWLADHFAGLQPTDASAWPLDWWDDDRYDRPAGSCDPRPPTDG